MFQVEILTDEQIKERYHDKSRVALVFDLLPTGYLLTPLESLRLAREIVRRLGRYQDLKEEGCFD